MVNMATTRSQGSILVKKMSTIISTPTTKIEKVSNQSFLKSHGQSFGVLSSEVLSGIVRVDFIAGGLVTG